MWTCAGILLAILCSVVHSQTNVTLSTKKGTIIGLRLDPNPATGVSYDAFIGIPYGKIPARFQLAVPADSWMTPLVTQTDGPACPQPNMKFDENCLYINVFTPKGASDTPGTLPVMAFIIGSGFTFSSTNSKILGPDFLIPENVILVTMNYRLGASGYLTLGSNLAPGNQGLYDTYLALQWIQDEISVFGGNASQVTLFGESAGSIMTQFHYLSSVSAGLFSMAIGQSGAALGGLGLTSVTEGVRRSKQLAERINCDSTLNDTLLLACLQAADIQDIVDNQFIDVQYNDKINGLGLPFVPVLDSYLTTDKPFFNDTLENLMTAALTRAKPLISGINLDEGTVVFYEPLFLDCWKYAEGNLSAFIPSKALAVISDDQKTAVVNQIRNRFFPNTVDENKVKGLVRLYSDFMFNYPTVQVARFFANLTYGYLMTYDGSWAPSPSYFSRYDMRGVAHGADLFYLFYHSINGEQPLDNCTLNNANLATRDRMVKWWTTFAKTGVPDPSWQTISNGGYMVIDSTPYTMNTSYFESQYYDFWANIENMTAQSSAVSSSFTFPSLFTVWALFTICRNYSL